jgi:hypothetical protein
VLEQNWPERFRRVWAVAAIARGEMEEGFDHLDRLGWVVEAPDEAARWLRRLAAVEAAAVVVEALPRLSLPRPAL